MLILAVAGNKPNLYAAVRFAAPLMVMVAPAAPPAVTLGMPDLALAAEMAAPVAAVSQVGLVVLEMLMEALEPLRILQPPVVAVAVAVRQTHSLFFPIRRRHLGVVAGVVHFKTVFCSPIAVIPEILGVRGRLEPRIALV
jgi:hypothetical protein